MEWIISNYELILITEKKVEKKKFAIQFYHPLNPVFINLPNNLKNAKKNSANFYIY